MGRGLITMVDLTGRVVGDVLRRYEGGGGLFRSIHFVCRFFLSGRYFVEVDSLKKYHNYRIECLYCGRKAESNSERICDGLSLRVKGRILGLYGGREEGVRNIVFVDNIDYLNDNQLDLFSRLDGEEGEVDGL